MPNYTTVVVLNTEVLLGSEKKKKKKRPVAAHILRSNRQTKRLNFVSYAREGHATL